MKRLTQQSQRLAVIAKHLSSHEEVEGLTEAIKRNPTRAMTSVFEPVTQARHWQMHSKYSRV